MSLRRRILEPVVILTVCGAMAAVLISHSALRSFDRAQQEAARAQAAWEHVRQVDYVVTDFKALVQDVASFNRFAPPNEVAARFSALERAMNAEIAEMHRLAAGGEVAVRTGDLELEAIILTGEAAAVLGVRPARSVPTRAYLETRIDRVRAALEDLDNAVSENARLAVAETRHGFVTHVMTVLVGLLIAFVATAGFSSMRANTLVRALGGLSDAMDRIRNADLNAEVPHIRRRDEIGAMARNVAAFASGLRELTAAKARIEHMALHDPLTHLPNRRALQARLNALLEQGGEADAHAVLHIDLDRFKTINDTYGHAAGDEVLRHAAQAMRSAARPGDVVARLGGDEFAVLMSGDVDQAAAARVAEQIIFEVKKPISFGDAQIHAGASIGVAFVDGADGGVERVLANADIALYDAKAAGRDRVMFYDGRQRAEADRRAWVLREIRDAIGVGEVCAFFQPQVDCRSGAVVGFETLARWRHPERGVLQPSSFLDIAFDAGLGDAITRTSLRCAVEAMARWRAQGSDDVRVSVNLAASQLRTDAMIGEILSTLEGAGLPPSRLAVEVLENVLFTDDDPAVARLNALRAAGVRVELDNFGSGHASIANLKRFAIDRIKLDRALVAGAAGDVGLRAILSAVIDLAASLDIECLAEGVETAEDAALLEGLGCNLMQGYRIARPMPLDEATAWLSDRRELNAPAAKAS